MLNTTRAAGPITVTRYTNGQPAAVETIPSPAETGQHAGPGNWNKTIKPAKRGPKPGAKKSAAQMYADRAHSAARLPHEYDDFADDLLS